MVDTMFDGELPDEQIPDVTQLGEGFYHGVIGRIYRKKDKKEHLGTWVDIFLLNKRPLDDADASPELIMKVVKAEGGTSFNISFRKNSNGEPIIKGSTRRLVFTDLTPDMHSYRQERLAFDKKQFAASFDAVSKDNKISWNKIKEFCGTIVSFNMTSSTSKDKSKSYLNIDPQSFAALKQPVSIESMKVCYDQLKVYEESIQDRTDAHKTDVEDVPF